MSAIKTLFYLLRNDRKSIPTVIMRRLIKAGWTNAIPDRMFLQVTYKVFLGKKLNLNEPKTFNEKLQWLKLYDRDPAYCTMVDKYDVRDYISRTIGEEYLVPCLGVWEKAEHINFQQLPDKFVLKCTHDSGSVILCDKETLNQEKVKKRLHAKLGKNMFWWGREWPYKGLKPRIIAEEFMQDESGELRDYKFMCFNGKVKCSFVCTDRFSDKGLHVTFLDRDWNVMPFERSFPAVKQGLPRPKNYEKMIELAEKLSAGIPFVRVDFYEVNERIYFGELTFFPGNGMEAFQPEEWDYRLGEWITLPEKTK